MRSNGPIDVAMLRREWAAVAGNHAHASKINPYDPTRDGVGYVLKWADRDPAYWGVSPDLGYFLREAPTGSNTRSRRRARRHALRVLAAVSSR